MDSFSPDPNTLPRKIELEVPIKIAAWARLKAQETGRSEEEVLLELLDRGLGDY